MVKALLWIVCWVMNGSVLLIYGCCMVICLFIWVYSCYLWVMSLGKLVSGILRGGWSGG